MTYKTRCRGRQSGTGLVHHLEKIRRKQRARPKHKAAKLMVAVMLGKQPAAKKRARKQGEQAVVMLLMH
jgi:hypothetical protein